ncbi:hypothetical protein B7463_g10050, partial [Scytalidium lignicola]
MWSRYAGWPARWTLIHLSRRNTRKRTREDITVARQAQARVDQVSPVSRFPPDQTGDFSYVTTATQSAPDRQGLVPQSGNSPIIQGNSGAELPNGSDPEEARREDCSSEATHYAQASYIGESGYMPVLSQLPVSSSTHTAEPVTIEVRLTIQPLPPTLQISYADTFLKMCSTFCPILDKQTLKTTEFRASLLLQQALALVGGVLQPSLLHEETPSAHYEKAKLLLHGGYEPNPLASLIAVMLFYWWSTCPPNIVSMNGSWWWTGIAIRQAQEVGYHRELKMDQHLRAGETIGIRSLEEAANTQIRVLRVALKDMGERWPSAKMYDKVIGQMLAAKSQHNLMADNTEHDDPPGQRVLESSSTPDSPLGQGLEELRYFPGSTRETSPLFDIILNSNKPVAYVEQELEGLDGFSMMLHCIKGNKATNQPPGDGFQAGYTALTQVPTLILIVCLLWQGCRKDVPGESLIKRLGIGTLKKPGANRSGLKHKVISFMDTPLKFHGFDDEVSFNTQCSSQWDSLCHYFHQDSKTGYNGCQPSVQDLTQEWGNEDKTKSLPTLNREPSDFYPAAQYANILYLHWHERGGLVARGVLLDFKAYAKAKGIQFDAFSDYRITTQQLQDVATHQGVIFKEGDVCIIRTGFTEQLGKADADEQMKLFSINKSAGVNPTEDSARWFWNNGFSAVASDNIAFETKVGDGRALVLHQYFLSLYGMHIGELWDLKALSEECARLKRYTFFFTSCPLNVPGAVGSPPNALAIF